MLLLLLLRWRERQPLAHALPRQGDRHCPRALPQLRGQEGPEAGVSSPYQIVASTGSASKRRLCIQKGGKKKREGKKAHPPTPPHPPALLRCPDLATCCLPPLGECHRNPCLLTSGALGKESRGEPHAPGCKAREGGSGGSSRLAMLASRCKCAVSPGGQTSSGTRSASPGASNSSTCRPITQ